MKSILPTGLTLQRWAVMLILVALIPLAWLKPLDSQAQEHAEAGLKRALATYVVARTINALVSVIQETGVSVQPGGIGMTFAPAQFLDPLNDLVEQVSTVMLAVCVSFGIQLMLMQVGGSAAVSLVLTAGLLAWGWYRWRGRAIPRWATRLLVLIVLARFGVPLASIGSELTFRFAMSDQYLAAQQKLDATAEQVRRVSPLGSSDTPGEKPSWWETLKRLPESMDMDSKVQQVQGRFEQIRSWLDGMVDHVVRVIAIFTVQTVLLPLLFLWLLGKLLGFAVVRPR